ncbi:MAG: hypothetical protein DRG30_01425 [Epsilonproteobacteria bacterium]|nr:MAG: hypothetical protein DRG30_01425 [Campylobacterota bacterium]
MDYKKMKIALDRANERVDKCEEEILEMEMKNNAIDEALSYQSKKSDSLENDNKIFLARIEELEIMMIARNHEIVTAKQQLVQITAVNKDLSESVQNLNIKLAKATHDRNERGVIIKYLQDLVDGRPTHARG